MIKRLKLKERSPVKRLTARSFTPCLIALLATACADTGASLEAVNTDDCPQGKCDRVSDQVQELYSDMKRISLDDLVSLGAGFATDELNDQLSGLSFLDIKLSETALFGMEARTLFGQTIVENINELQAGLTVGLGEDAFSTQINGLRVNTLAQRPGAVFAETSFRLGGALSQSWSVNHGEWLGSLGFDLSPSLEAIVIAPYQDVTEAVISSPLSALKAARGFILPRDVSDLLSMEAGSSVTLRGEGVVGLNLGLGLPLVATALNQYLNLTAKLSGAARVSMSGDLDIQLVRGEGKTVYLDVGLTEQRVKHLSVAIETGYGVEGLPIPELKIGGLKVDLADVLERAFERHLNDKLSPLDARRSSSQLSGRLSVARFEFDLGNATTSLTQALTQGLRGDIRLAQALAHRGNSGVTRHLELTKDFEIDSKYLGFRLLSMRFFTSSEESRGSVNIGTNGENQEILFAEMERKGGLFFTERGSNWRQTTSTIRRPGQEDHSLNNARLIITEHDNFLSKDQINDHLDSLLAYFYGGDAVFEVIGALADQLSEYADHSCGPRPDSDASGQEKNRYEQCLLALPMDPKVRQLVDAVYSRSSGLEGRWASQDFSPMFEDAITVGQKVLAARVGISSIHDPTNVSLSGPSGTLVTQVRFSDQGVRSLMTPDAPERFKKALQEVMALMNLDREDDMDDRVEERADYLSGKERRVSDVVETYKAIMKRHQQFTEVAALTWRDGTAVSEEAMLLLVPEDRDASPSLRSIAQLKGDLVGTLYGELIESARWLGEPDTLLVGYALLNMVPPSEIELMLTGGFEEEHKGGYHNYNYHVYSRGIGDLIEAGIFNLEELLGAKSL